MKSFDFQHDGASHHAMEHEDLLEACNSVANSQAMRVRRVTAEHPFGTLKMRMGNALPDENAAGLGERNSYGPSIFLPVGRAICFYPDRQKLSAGRTNFDPTNEPPAC